MEINLFPVSARLLSSSVPSVPSVRRRQGQAVVGRRVEGAGGEPAGGGSPPARGRRPPNSTVRAQRAQFRGNSTFNQADIFSGPKLSRVPAGSGPSGRAGFSSRSEILHGRSEPFRS